jgi:hypothetical protein
MSEENQDKGGETTENKGGDQAGKQTFVIPAKNTPEPEKKMNLVMAQAAGWSEDEIKMGKETGILDEKAEAKVEEGKSADEKSQAEADKGEKETENKGQNGVVKEQHLEDFLLSPEEEKSLSDAIKNPKASAKLKNVAAQYFGRKSAISRAQFAESERNRLLKQNLELTERLARIEEKIDKGQGADQDQIDEEDDKPLTKKALNEMLMKMREDDLNAKRKHQDLTARQAEKIKESLLNQENHAKIKHEDYEAVVDLADKLVRRDSAGKFISEVNITTLPELDRKKSFFLLHQIKNAAIRADEMSVEDYNIADMTYELGLIAKKYLKPIEEDKSINGDNAERNDGGLTPEEEAERIRKNQSRPSSSASISGNGGRRSVTVDDITIDDLNQMDSKTFDAFQKQHPDKVDELMRG